MGYYDNQKEFESRGIDYDLVAAIDYNECPFSAPDIERVLAVWEGENDGDSWRWIVLLKDGTFYYMLGGCDYTGWDCQSDLTTEQIPNPVAIPSDEKEVMESLLAQVNEGKNKTWRETMDGNLGDLKEANWPKEE